MTQISLTLQTVTPMFLAGAEPRGEPELRAPAFRGAMRYWLRAALGNSLKGANPQELYKRECNVFGGAASEDGGSASVINVRLKPVKMKDKQQFPKKVPPNTGYGYLYWSLAESGEGRNHLEPKWFYPPGSKFEISISTRPLPGSGTTAAFNQAIISLWLLVRLGGIGARSRRLAGSLDAISKPATDLKFQIEANTISGISDELRDGLRYILKMMGSSPITKIPEYDTLSPDHCRIWVLGEWDTAKDAQEAVGLALKNARQDKALTSNQKALFGLPAKGSSLGIKRRSSPLWLKLSSVNEGKKYVAIATLFKSQFSPADSGDYTPMEKWLENKKVFAKSREVLYA